MTTPSDKPNHNSFSSFGIGIALGITAAFLFGTEEGRKLIKKLVDSIPDSSLRGTPRQSIPSYPIEETQHHATYEAPPPPAPSIRPSRPEPFTPRGSV